MKKVTTLSEAIFAKINQAFNYQNKSGLGFLSTEIKKSSADVHTLVNEEITKKLNQIKYEIKIATKDLEIDALTGFNNRILELENLLK